MAVQIGTLALGSLWVSSTLFDLLMDVSPSDVTLLMINPPVSRKFLVKHASPTILHKIRKDAFITILGRMVLNSYLDHVPLLYYLGNSTKPPRSFHFQKM